VRKAAGLRVRLPLPSLTVAAADAERLAPFTSLIADEMNVKEVQLSTDVAAAGQYVLQVVPAVLGPRMGPAVQQVIRAVRAGEWERQPDGSVVVGGHTLADDEYTLRLVPADEATTRALAGERGLVVVDTTATPEMEAEGLARDVVRLVQQARKDAGLHVSDRIHLVVDVGHHDDVHAALEAHRAWVAEQTLAPKLVLAGPISDGRRYELGDGRALHVGLHKLD
jgi:isoleucyl-tRNA synthetase